MKPREKIRYLVAFVNQGVKSSMDAYNYLEGYIDGIVEAIATLMDDGSNIDKDNIRRDINSKIMEHDSKNDFYGNTYLKNGMVVRDKKTNGLFYVYKTYRFTTSDGIFGEEYEIFIIDSEKEVPDEAFECKCTDSEYHLFIRYTDGGYPIKINFANYDSMKETYII